MAWGGGVGVTVGVVVGCWLRDSATGLGVGVLARNAPGFRLGNVGVGTLVGAVVVTLATGVGVGVAEPWILIVSAAASLVSVG